MDTIDMVLKSSWSIIGISVVLGTILGTMDIIEIHKNFMNFKDFYVFHMHMCHSNGTQVVPKISK